LEAAIATVQQNRTDRERLADLRAMLERLRGRIADGKEEAVTYATRMKNELACLTRVTILVKISFCAAEYR
jgi:hypothetical protein